MQRLHYCFCVLGPIAAALMLSLPGCSSGDSSSGTPPDTSDGSAQDSSAESGHDGSAGSSGDGGTDSSIDQSSGDSSPEDSSLDAQESSTEDAPRDVNTGEQICTPAAFRCEANQLRRCNSEGTAWMPAQPCATSALCNADEGKCNPPACQPSEYRCTGAVLEACKSDQTGWETKATCASSAHCRADYQTCSVTPCLAGSHQCSGNELQVCNAQQTQWVDVQTCGSSVLCDSAANSCGQAACAAGQFRCQGADLSVCNFGLTGWFNVRSCDSPEHCDEAHGECDVCTANVYTCNGADLYHCSSDGQVLAHQASCSSADRCNVISGGCDRSCENNQTGANASCGPTSDDCCGTDLIPGGTFKRSYDGVNYTNGSYDATVAAFRLEKFEVTVGRFREFIEAGGGTQATPPQAGDGAHPYIQNSGWDAAWNSFLATDAAALKTALNCDVSYQTWTDAPGANETKPINCVTWYEAFAYCAWAGRRLPTEAEWNYAASGGDEQRVYPWGQGIDQQHADYGCEADGNPGCAGTDILTVGTLSPAGDGRWGQHDLAGSMSEWVLDKFMDPYPTPCVNCAAITIGSGRIRRGGAWNEINPNRLRNGSRESANPEHRFTHLGFRCARSVDRP